MIVEVKRNSGNNQSNDQQRIYTASWKAYSLHKPPSSPLFNKLECSEYKSSGPKNKLNPRNNCTHIHRARLHKISGILARSLLEEYMAVYLNKKVIEFGHYEILDCGCVVARRADIFTSPAASAQ